MRMLFALFAAMLAIPAVFGLGIARPSGLEGLTITAGDERELSFLIKGDGNENVGYFFIESSSPGLFFEGRQRSEDGFRINPFENQAFEVDMLGVQKGTYTVKYGYVLESDGSGFQIDQEVSDTFTVLVKNTSTSGSGGVNVTVNPSTGGSGPSGGSSGSSGGSSGGSGGAPVVSGPTKTQPQPSAPLPSNQEIQMSDISSQGSSLSEVSVGDRGVSVVSNQESSGVSGVAGMLPDVGLTMILAIGFISLVLNAVVLKMAWEEKG